MGRSMEHTEQHPMQELWNRLVCLVPGCGVVQPKLLPDPEPAPTTEDKPVKKTRRKV